MACSSPGSTSAAFCSIVMLRIFVAVAEDPALALGDDLVAEFFHRQFVAPVAERALGKLLDVALVHDGHDALLVIERVLNRAAHQPLRSKRGDRLDGHAGIGANLLWPAAQHFLVQEFEQLLHFGRAGLPLDPDINIFGIFAVNDDIHPLGMLHRRGDTLEIAHRAHAGVEIEDLPQRDVERANPAADRSRQRPLDRNSEIAHGLDGFVGQPLLEFVERLFSGEHFKPRDLPLPAVDQIDGGVKHAPRRLPDVPPRAVALDEGNDGPVGNDEFASNILDCLSVGRNGPAVIRWLHVYVPLWIVTAVTRMGENNTPGVKRTPQPHQIPVSNSK